MSVLDAVGFWNDPSTSAVRVVVSRPSLSTPEGIRPGEFNPLRWKDDRGRLGDVCDTG